MPKVCGEVLTCEAIAGRDKLKKVTVDIGASEALAVTTNAPNLRVGTRTVVATVGTELEINGEMIIVQKTNVGGAWSDGMICDSVMLGWKGGAAGIAVQVPASCALGSDAPTNKPRLDGDDAPAAAEPEMTAKQLREIEKATKKAAAAEKKLARLATKGDKKGKKDKEEEEEVEEVEETVFDVTKISASLDTITKEDSPDK